MKHYFIIENDQQSGPYTIDELKSKKLRKSTSLWTDGMQDWAPAESMDELKDFLISDPPPYTIRASSEMDKTTQANSTSKQQSFPIWNEFFSGSRGLLIGAIIVILFSTLNWAKISIFSYNLKFNLFSLSEKLNNRYLKEIIDYSEEATLIRLAVVILTIALLLSFALLILSLVKYKLKSRSVLAFCGFALSVIVSSIFILAMIYIGVKIEQNMLTIFPFLTLGSAILSMIFFVKRPEKIDFSEIASELKLLNSQIMDNEPQIKTKKRNDLVTIWLWILIGSCGISIIAANKLPAFTWLAWFASFLDIVFIYLLFKNKKNGFWGLCITAIIGMVAYFVVSSSFAPYAFIKTVLGIAINYAIFQIKNNKISFWSQLEITNIDNDLKEIFEKLKRNPA